MKPVAVIILNWNGAKLLRKYLPTVLAGTNADIADVIVADNGSTDDSIAVLEQEFPQVKVLRFEKNYGFAGGYNKAINLTGYRYTVLLNSDVRTPEGWLEPMYDYMENNPGVGAVQPKLLHDRDDGKRMFEYAGAAGGFIDKHGYPYCRGRVFEAVEDDHGQYDGQDIDIFWATGACLMVRTELYEKVGGLDEDFFAHMEEIDFCWRAKIGGHKVLYVPEATVYHVGGGTLPKSSPFKTQLNFRNNLAMLYKNLPPQRQRRVLCVRWLLDWVAALSFLLKGNGGEFAAVFKAHREFRRWLPALRAKRAAINPHEVSCVYRRSLLVDYHLRGRKHFAQLDF